MTARIDRVSKETLEAWRTELSEWTHPEDFRSRVTEIVTPLFRKSLFFRQAGLMFLRDAWIAGRVATALPCDSVRLVPAERPDFEFERSGQTHQFEATEADMDGRRRGDEPDDFGLRPDPVEDWRKRFEAIPAALDRVVAKKVSKEYPPHVGLVIYLNLNCYGAYVNEGIPILRRHSAPAKDKFKSVFILWEGALYKLWEDGESALDQWQYARPDDA